MIYGVPIGPAKYLVIDMMRLPEDVHESIECPGNDVAHIVNPEYHPILSQWLAENDYPITTCYIAWWSW